MRKGRGEPVDPSSWPEEESHRRLLKFLDAIREDNGMKSLRAIAPRMKLSSPNRVGQLLRGVTLPSSESQLRDLVGALGGGESDVARGLELYRKAKRVHRPRAVSGPGRAGWWRRSGYIRQVRQLAPIEEIRDRGHELAELAEFCTGDEWYVWWQAGPWAGKSALMATFVLNPPPRVDVVSFFVTARMSAQADSIAFTEALLDQLGAILGEQLPPLPTPSARHTHYQQLLSKVPAHLQATGRRLILLVDGLDEDRGTAQGSGLASIASLLPRAPEDGLKIIVSGRPDPPLPLDVADDHPLRHCRVRKLAASPHAKELERLAWLELRDVLGGDQLHVDVIGLIAACGGGLGLPDLQDLTSVAAPFEFEELLGGVVGRTIAGRDYGWASAPQPVFLFTHETLRIEAIRRLGAALGRYRDRIHTWALTYRERGWPAGTPLYLLNTYPRMLRETRDTSRLIDLALDSGRHERLLELTGGDFAAFSEIEAAQELVLSQEDPDLIAMARLAVRREKLAVRNAKIPSQLPAVWAALGHRVRAEALARGITAPRGGRDEALATVAQKVAQDGDYATAQDIGTSITNPYSKVKALAAIADVAVEAGDVDQATAILAEALAAIGAITDDEVRAWAMTALAVIAAKTGDHARANMIIDEIRRFPNLLADALVRLAVVLADAGNGDLLTALVDAWERAAGEITDADTRQWAMAVSMRVAAAAGDLTRAENLTVRITDPYRRVEALTSLARAAAFAGEYAAAAAHAREAETYTSAIPHLHDRDRARAGVVGALAAARDYDHAQSVADGITDDHAQGDALVAVVRAMAISGDHDRAATIIRGMRNQYRQTRAWTTVVTVLGHREDYDHAEALARSITDPDQQLEALTAVAQALADAGYDERATIVALAVETLARHAAHVDQPIEPVATLATALANAGYDERATEVAQSVEEIARNSRSSDAIPMIKLAIAMSRTGAHDRAEALAHSIPDPTAQTWALTALANNLTEAGEYDRAETIARSLAGSIEQAQAIAALAETLADAGHTDRAITLIDAADRIASTIELEDRRWVLTAIADAAVAAGDNDRAAAAISAAEAATRAITDPYLMAQMYTTLAKNAVATGDHLQVKAQIAEAQAAATKITNPERHAEALTDLIKMIAGAGQYAQAEAMAGRIPDDDRRSWALSAVVDSATAADRLDEAERLAHTIPQDYERATALAIVAGRLLVLDEQRAGELVDLAERCARGVPGVEEQSDALSAFVDAMTAAGNIDRAETVARSIALHDIRAEALAAVAETVLPDHARRLIAEALSVGSWATPVDLLARLDPTILLVLADEVLRHS